MDQYPAALFQALFGEEADPELGTAYMRFHLVAYDRPLMAS